MSNAKFVTIPFATHFKLSVDISLKIDDDMKHMANVPYSSVVGSIIMSWFAIILIFHIQSV